MGSAQSKNATDPRPPRVQTLAAARRGHRDLLDGYFSRLATSIRRARRPIHPLELPPAEEDHSFEHLAAEKPELFPVDPRLLEHLRNHAARTPGLRLTSHAPPSRRTRPSDAGPRMRPRANGARRGSA